MDMQKVLDRVVGDVETNRALPGELGGVLDQVDQDLLQAQVVAVDGLRQGGRLKVDGLIT